MPVKVIKKNIVAILGYVLLAISLVVNFFLFNKANSPNSKSYQVKQVLDGDTFVVNDNIIIRLFSVEAPEMELCGGPEAKKVLEDLILNKNITLDVQLRDSYGRQLAAVRQGNNLINKKVLESGWFYYNSVNYEDKELLKEAYHKALNDKIGIFSDKCTQIQNPNNPKCSIKGNISHDDHKKYYHFPGCGRYDEVTVELFYGENWYCSEKEAQAAGFIKSKNCFDKKF
jgi:endonuclease YncB( thermonuclease family)